MNQRKSKQPNLNSLTLRIDIYAMYFRLPAVEHLFRPMII